MPAKKDGQPPPKPKPEELIAEFKEKFEKYSLEVNEESSKIDEKIKNLKVANDELEQKMEEIEELHKSNLQTINSTITKKIDSMVDQFREEMQLGFSDLENQLSKGMIDNVQKKVI